MDIRKFNLNLLIALDALLDERNVTRAAARLSMSQPALSNALHRLRTALGDPLFTRGQRGLIPTERALALGPAVKRLLNDAKAIVEPPVFDPATAVRDFRFATTDYMQLTVLLPFVERLQALAPNISVAVRSLELPDIPERLANGDLDLGITIPSFARPDFRSKHLYTDRYVGVARSGHPITIGPVTIEAFCQFPHALVVPTGGTVRGPVDDALAAANAQRRVRMSVPSFLTLPFILAQTDLIAVAPERLALRLRDRLAQFEIPVSVPTFDVIAVWHPRAHNDPTHQWMRRKLAALVSDGR